MKDFGIECKREPGMKKKRIFLCQCILEGSEMGKGFRTEPFQLSLGLGAVHGPIELFRIDVAQRSDLH